nr:MAG TPA: hypothetical protein [Caudoviricetes sp.]
MQFSHSVHGTSADTLPYDVSVSTPLSAAAIGCRIWCRQDCNLQISKTNERW